MCPQPMRKIMLAPPRFRDQREVVVQVAHCLEVDVERKPRALSMRIAARGNRRGRHRAEVGLRRRLPLGPEPHLSRAGPAPVMLSMPSTQGLPARMASISLLAELHGESLVLRMFGLSWGTDGSGVTDQCIPSTRTLRTHSTASSVMPASVAPLATVESWGTRPRRSMQVEPRTVLRRRPAPSSSCRGCRRDLRGVPLQPPERPAVDVELGLVRPRRGPRSSGCRRSQAA